MQFDKTFLKTWIPLAIVATTLSFLIYLLVQQDVRQVANDPQIQMARDAALSVSAGKPIQNFNPQEKIDITKSLSPFTSIYDAGNNPIVSNATLANGNLPLLSSGIFAYAKKYGEDRITWEPAPGVRNALVVVAYPNGFVAVGRSLSEVEIRESKLLQLSIIDWIGTLVVTFFAAWFISRKR